MYRTQNFFRALFNIYSFYLFVLIHKSENISKLYVLYDNEKLLKHYRVAVLGPISDLNCLLDYC